MVEAVAAVAVAGMAAVVTDTRQPTTLTSGTRSGFMLIAFFLSGPTGAAALGVMRSRKADSPGCGLVIGGRNTRRRWGSEGHAGGREGEAN